MAKSGTELSKLSSRADLATAVREVAQALRSQEKADALQRQAENRRQLAEKIMAWANLVFAGLVIAQAFSDKFDYLAAVVGGGLFIGAYLLARRVMRGGER